MMTFIKITKNHTLNNRVKIEKTIMASNNEDTLRVMKYIFLAVGWLSLICVIGASLETYIKGQNNVLKDLPPNTEIKLNNRTYLYTGKGLIPLEDK